MEEEKKPKIIYRPPYIYPMQILRIYPDIYTVIRYNQPIPSRVEEKKTQQAPRTRKVKDILRELREKISKITHLPKAAITIKYLVENKEVIVEIHYYVSLKSFSDLERDVRELEKLGFSTIDIGCDETGLFVFARKEL